MSSKPKVLLFFSRHRSTQGLNVENMKDLIEACDVDVLVGRDKNRVSFGNPIGPEVLDLPPWKEKAWYIQYYFHFLRFLKNFDHEWLESPHLYKGMSPRLITLVKFLRRLKLLGAASFFCRLLLKLRNPYKVLEPKYDAVIAYSGLKDVWYDDVARWAKKHHIPILAIASNWDNLSSKPFIERPDYVGVWGLQNMYFARAYQNFPFQQIFQVGAARFEDHYRLTKLTKEEWRRRLGLPTEGRLLFFAGAGENFDEGPLLQSLDEALVRGELPADTTILYKPHPLRFPDFEKSFLSRLNLQKVRIWQGLKVRGLPENSALLAASDAIISPYSTMVLEGAYFGLPSVGIFYNDPNHADHDWDVYGRHVNLLPMFRASWNIEVRSKTEIVDAVKKLLSLIGKPEIAEAARRDYDHCIYRDVVPYGRRLAISLETILKREILGSTERPHTIYTG